MKERELKAAEDAIRIEKEKAEFEKRKQEEFEDMLKGEGGG